MGHEKTGEELEALCSEHPEQVEQLTKENLEILISWRICYKYWDKQPNSKHAKNEFGFRSVC